MELSPVIGSPRLSQQLVGIVAALGLAASAPKIVELNLQFTYVGTYDTEFIWGGDQAD